MIDSIIYFGVHFFIIAPLVLFGVIGAIVFDVAFLILIISCAKGLIVFLYNVVSLKKVPKMNALIKRPAKKSMADQ